MKDKRRIIEKRHIIFIVSIIVLIFINQMIIQEKINTRIFNNEEVRIADEQQMIGQRITKIVLLIHYHDYKFSTYYSLDTLQKLSKKLDTNYQTLQNGNNAVEKNERLAALLTANKKSLDVLLSLTNKIISNPSPDNINSYINIVSQQDLPFLRSSQKLSNLYRELAAKKLESVKNIQLTLSIIIIIALIVVFFFSIFPISQELKNKNALLSVNNERFKLNESKIREQIDQLNDYRKMLEYSERHNKIFIEQSPSAIAMFDNQLNYIAASHKWLEDYQLGEIDIVGMSHYQLFPNIPKEWKEIHQLALKGNILKSEEDSLLRADGTTQWISWEVRPWYVNEDEVGGLIMYTHDITEQKEISLAKAKIEEILDKTNEVARIGTWELLLKEEKVIWSRIVKEIHELDLDHEPQLSTGINFYKEGKSRALIQEVITRAIEKGESFDVELELVTAKGNNIWVRSIGQAEMKDGICIRLYGVFQDISATKNYQRSLGRANNELNAILNSGPVSIITTDEDGIITKFNKGAESLLQYSAEELVGKQSPKIIHLEEEVIARGKELSEIYNREISGFDVFIEVAKHHDFESREWTYVKKDGTHLIVQLIVTALRNEDNEITAYLGVATDISEKVNQRNEMIKVNTDLEVLTQKLTQKNKQLANFSHITSHNLRSPVGNLNSLLQFYKMAETEDEREMLFEKFEIVINHLTSTLGTLVDAIKVRETEHQDLKIITFEEVLLKTKEIFSGQILETGMLINFDFENAPDIVYNITYLESIFLNLISNSIKYRSPQRKPIITIKTEFIDDRVTLTFKDNGLGIDLQRHGDKLFGLNKTFHRHAEAKGVGLYMTKIQIESLGGNISATSEVNNGTTFTINF